MSAEGELLVGLAIAAGLVGVIVQVLPGTLVILAAITVWAVVTGGPAAWATLAVAALALGASTLGKYVLAGRHLRRSAMPSSTLVWGGVAGIVGFFVIPVVGLFVGFVLGVYLAELARLRDHRSAWRATVVALKATGITILVELAGALVAAAAWLVAVIWLT